MRTVGSYEAKTHLPRLLDEVAKGERITITKHGHPVAMLVPPGAVSRPDADAALARIPSSEKVSGSAVCRSAS